MKRAFGAGPRTCTTLLAFSALLLGTAVPALAGSPRRVLIIDVSRLNPTHVSAVVQEKEIEGLQAALAEARERHLKVSIAGKRHSMGGHAFYEFFVNNFYTTYVRPEGRDARHPARERRR